MKAIKHIRSHCTPLFQADIDTDMIIPAQFLTQTVKTGLGQHVFSRLAQAQTHFPLNLPAYQHSHILLAGDNFGCGSSREHAVWALMDWGFQAIIAPSFADIFKNNAQKNGLLLIELESALIQQWVEQASDERFELHIDVEKQSLSGLDHHHTFSMDPFFKTLLINGMDELSYLSQQQSFIDHYHLNARNQTRFLNPDRSTT